MAKCKAVNGSERVNGCYGHGLAGWPGFSKPWYHSSVYKCDQNAQMLEIHTITQRRSKNCLNA